MGKHLNARTRIDYMGKRFGRLVVTQCLVPSGYMNQGGTWLCQCDCGERYETYGHHLKDKESCGCAWKERMKAANGMRCRKYSGTTVTSQYHSHRQSAKLRGLTPLEREAWEKIVFWPCHYCGQTDVRNRAHLPGYRAKHINQIGEEGIARYEANINGVDRVDSSLGYSPGNCVPCCEMCNSMKLDYTVQEFSDQIKRVYANMGLGDHHHDATQ